MKTLVRTLLAAVFLSVVFVAAESQAGVRVYVRMGPPRMKTVKIIKPRRPYRNAVWVSGHWTHKHGRYVWGNGFWVKRRPGRVYVQPHWKKTHRGYFFVPGHWVKIR